MSDKRKKILFVVEAMGGGVFTFLVGLCNELVEYYDIYVAYGIRQQTPDDFRKYFDGRVHMIRVRHFERSIAPRHDVGAFLELRKIADRVKPDLIHLHSSKAGVLGRWAFDGKEIPLFYTPHGYSFLMSNYNAVRRFSYRMVEKLSTVRRCTTISCSEGEHLIVCFMEIDMARLLASVSLQSVWNDSGFSSITMGNIIMILVGCMGLGLVHIITGMVISCVIKARRGEYMSILWNEVTWWVVFAGRMDACRVTLSPGLRLTSVLSSETLSAKTGAGPDTGRIGIPMLRSTSGSVNRQRPGYSS